jgi:flagellar motility protein MotE (MotC chaperone)
MRMRVRLLPALIFAATLMVTARVGQIFSGIAPSDGLFFGLAPARAQSAPQATAKKGKDEAARPSPGAAQSPEKKGDPSATTEKTDPAQNAASDVPPGLKDPHLFSAAEIQTLQRLADRRDALDARERALDERAKVLKAIEARVDGQLAALKESQARLQGLLKAYDEQEAEKIRSLVKIYETMKPAEAARIFEKLDGKVLLDVLHQMKAAKSAPIFAAMNPQLAREMTQALAERSQMPREGETGGPKAAKTASP